MKFPKVVLLDIDNTVYDYHLCHEAALHSASAVAATIDESWGDPKVFRSLYSTARKAAKARLGNQAAAHSRLLYFKLMLESRYHRSDIPNCLRLDEAYWQGYFDAMSLDPGCRECLQFLKDCGVKLAWISNFTTELQMLKLRRIDLEEAVEYLFTSEEVGADKPDPAVLDLALSTLGETPEDAWLIGDDIENDVALAKLRNMTSVRLRRNNDEIHDDDADYVADNWFEIMEIFKKLGGTRDIDELARACRWAGKEPLLVQAGGGNVSVKSGDREKMLIKTSGYRLSQVTHNDGYMEVDLQSLLNLLRDKDLDRLTPADAHELFLARVNALTGRDSKRPSLETSFHAVLGRVVLHTHPVYVNAFACMEGGKEVFEGVTGRPPLWIPYSPPGYSLGRAIDKLYNSGEDLGGSDTLEIVLENHGLIVSSADADLSIRRTEELIEIGKGYFGPLHQDAFETAPISSDLLEVARKLEEAGQQRAQTRLVAQPARNKFLMRTAMEADLFLTGGPIAPDDVVYNGPRVFESHSVDEAVELISEIPQPLLTKTVIVLKNKGVMFMGASPAAVDAMEESLLAHALIRMLIAGKGSVKGLSDDEISYLASMEAEKHRQKVASELEGGRKA
jgi:putative hydrolase of the HAD superfamily